MEAIKPEEWEEWRLSPVTQALFHRFLPQARQGLMEQWASRAFQGSLRDEVLTLNSAALGELEAYKRIEEMTLEDFNDTITEESKEDG